jgi:hypothetical protein
MHRLRLLEVAHAVSTGELRLPPPLLDDVLSLSADLDGGPPVTTDREVAAAGASRWAMWGNDARRAPDEARLARIVKEAYEVRWAELGATS